ncbi:MAG: exosortase A [Novosphingobium sp.]|nr:exosortase A [Novosphingobium sp.]
MPPDVAVSNGHRGWWSEHFPPDWRAALAPATAAVLIVAVAFATDWSRIAAIAWQSSTFNHILLIPLILWWMVAQRAPELRTLVPAPWWPGFLLTAAGAMVWLLGTFSGMDLASQLGAVAVLVSLVPLFLGVRVTAALTFPLLYAFLLVPMGEELVPALQLLTAKITVALVEASGIPAHIEGVFIDTPAGLFEVAEACSGVKFLIAMFALGLLAANICFVSWRRRIAFMAICVVVPILANGVRAFATIWIAQSVGAERAAGIDHIIYGWVFFAIVVALILAISWRFFDRAPTAKFTNLDALAGSPLLARFERQRIAPITALAGLVLIIGAAHLWARSGEALRADLPESVSLPEIEGWHPVAFPRTGLAWEPRAEGADQRLFGRYRNASGEEVDVFLALYSSQGDGHEPSGFGQGAMRPDSGWSWHSPGPNFPDAMSEYLRGDDGAMRLAVTWYASGDLVTGSKVKLKLHSMADKLRLSEEPAALLIVSAADRSADKARKAVSEFMRDAGPVRQWMDRIGITE